MTREDLILNLIPYLAGNLFTTERERESWVVCETISNRQRPTWPESEQVPCRQPCLYLLLITQLGVSGWK